MAILKKGNMIVGSMIRKKTKWSLVEQIKFLTCIGELLDRGYALSEAIESTKYYLNKEKQVDIEDCIRLLKGGETFYDNLVRLQFDQQILHFLFFAEKHGSYSTAILAACKLVNNKQETVKKMKKILYYPLFLLIFTFILLFFVQNLLLPKFQTIFHSMNIKETIFIQFLHLFDIWFPILLIILIVFSFFTFLYYIFIFSKKSKITQMNTLSVLPIIGKYFSFYFTHVISLQLSLLLTSGFSVFESLAFFQQNKTERLFAEIGKEAIRHLKKGQRLELAFIRLPFIDKEFTRILQHGQENGKLDQELLYFGTYCIHQMEDSINQNLKTMQPIMFSVIGVMIISIYLAVLLPMFQLMKGF